MKKYLWLFCLVLCLLTGCQSGGTPTSQETTPFTRGETYSDEQLSLSVQTVWFSDCVMAPLTDDPDNSFTTYAAKNRTDQRYVDCIADVKNLGSEPLDLFHDLYFYCTGEEMLYQDCMVLLETEDGTDLTDAAPANEEETGLTLESGASARIHYAIVLPDTVSPDNLELCFRMPASGQIYGAGLSDLLSDQDSCPVGTTLDAQTGSALTLKSASIVNEIKAVSPEGGITSLYMENEDEELVDFVVELTYNGSEPASPGTLFSGYAINADNIVSPGTLFLETGGDLTTSGTVQPGTTATLHLVFVLSDELTQSDPFGLYFDGKYYSIPAEFGDAA